MNTKRILLMVLMLLPFIASAKLDTATRNRFMKEADQAFKAGNYEAAQEIYLDIYAKNDDEAAEELLNKCKQCIDLLDEANTAARYGQYSEAIEKYRAIMELNPDDPNVPELLANCGDNGTHDSNNRVTINSGSKKPIDPDKVYYAVQVQAEYPGGSSARIQWLQDNIEWPMDANHKQIRGDVELEFIIERDGSVSNVTVKKSDNAGLNSEAIRLISSMPKWIPAKVRDQPVRSPMGLTLFF